MADNYIGIRVDAEVKKKLEDNAQKEHRSLSSYLRMKLSEIANSVLA